MPILAATAVAVGVDPALLMFPAVLAASVGFMLPVATAPNAIAYGSGAVDARIMLREGAVLDVIGVVVLSALAEPPPIEGQVFKQYKNSRVFIGDMGYVRDERSGIAVTRGQAITNHTQ